MGASDRFSYPGGELETFAAAVRWKAYWAKMIAPHLGPRVLDVGAGAGATARLLCSEKQVRWLALEPDPALAAQIRSSGAPAACEVRVGTIASLEPHESFDTILYIDVLEHIEDDRGELAAASAHVAEGGALVVLAPAHDYLYTAFDKGVGHYRRYNRRTLLAAAPEALAPVRVFYLDCVGMLASLGNRFALRTASPTAAQIAFWDRCMVPASRALDPLFGFRLGKTVVGVWRRR